MIRYSIVLVVLFLSCSLRDGSPLYLALLSDSKCSFSLEVYSRSDFNFFIYRSGYSEKISASFGRIDSLNNPFLFSTGTPNSMDSHIKINSQKIRIPLCAFLKDVPNKFPAFKYAKINGGTHLFITILKDQKSNGESYIAAVPLPFVENQDILLYLQKSSGEVAFLEYL